jgi:hypothetical protein
MPQLIETAREVEVRSAVEQMAACMGGSLARRRQTDCHEEVLFANPWPTRTALLKYCAINCSSRKICRDVRRQPLNV